MTADGTTWVIRGARPLGGEQAVPGDDRLLGHGGPAGQAKPPRGDPLIHLRALGERGLLGVLCDHPVEGLDVFERPPHEHGVGHAVPVVGEHPDPGGGLGHRAQLGEP